MLRTGVPLHNSRSIFYYLCMQRIKYSQKEYALEIFSSQAYFIVNKRLLIHYGPEVAIFLSNLIDRYKYFLDKESLKDDWFFMTHEKQMEQTGLTITKIRNCKNKLINDHILRVERRGTPAKEWYFIRFTKLLQLILPLPASRQETVCQDVRLRDEYNKTINNNKKNITKKEIKVKLSKRERAVVFLPLAQYLSKIICSSKNMKHTTQQLHSWAYDICQLVEDNGITETRIKQALIWYEKNIGGQYIPVIESGKSLKEKFSKLEAAMTRTNFKFSNLPEKKLEYGEWWYLRKDGKYYNKSNRMLM